MTRTETSPVVVKDITSPLRFFRICFGSLMVVYCIGKLSATTTLPYQKPTDVFSLQPFPLYQRVPSVLSSLAKTFPWASSSHLYWHAHVPLQVVFAVGILLGDGGASGCIPARLSCLCFSIFQAVTLLSSMAAYNNHEYMYSTLAFALALCDTSVSSVGVRSSTSTSTSGASSAVRDALPSEGERVAGWTCLLGGVVYLSGWSLVYGIPGSVGLCGFVVIVFGAILVTGRDVSMDDHAGTTEPPARSSRDPDTWIQMLRAYFTIIYFYAGVAKLEADWLEGWTIREVFRLWTGPTAPAHFVNKLLLENNTLPLLFAYGGLALDLVVLPALLNVENIYLRTLAAAAAVLFHISNHIFFVIETFPFVMIASTALFFDAKWINFCFSFFHKLFSLKVSKLFTEVLHQAGSLVATKCVPAAACIFLLLHIYIPLECAVLAPGSQDLCFTSWRMMTRSYKVETVSFNVIHPLKKTVDVFYPADFALTEAEVHLLALHEDYLLELVTRMRHTVLSSLPPDQDTGIYISADIWAQVNGPPIQRYVRAHANISGDFIRGAAASYQWLEPRLIMFRTLSWQQRYREYEAFERSRLSAEKRLSIMYFAERPFAERVCDADDHYKDQCLASPLKELPSLTILALQNTLIRVMAGSVYVASSRGIILSEDTCLLARGLIRIRAIGDSAAGASAATTPALWAVRNINEQVLIQPDVIKGQYNYSNKIIIKKIYDCSDMFISSHQ